MNRFTSAFFLGLLATALASPAFAADAPVDVKRDGAFGFPQAQAKALCDTDDLRLSFWNDRKHLYVQAILWKDDDDGLGETADGRPTGDTSCLLLDVDADGTVTPKVDRTYDLNPWPHLPGLRYQVQLGGGSSTHIQSDSKGRGAIRYLPSPGGKKVRVDSLVIPLDEIGRQPGDKIRFAYWGASTKPDLTVNSVGHEAKGKYYSHALPHAKYHEIMLSDRAEALDVKAVPDGSDDSCPLPKKNVKPMPRVGAAAPELTAKDWINSERPPRLADLRGKVVLLDFWATWCGPCVKGIPHLNDLHDKYGPKGLRVIGFADQSKQGLTGFVTQAPIKYTVGAGGDLDADYGVPGLPYAFLIGKDGKVLWSGRPSEGELDKAIAAALKE